jgi:hypothetical protein
MVGSTRNAKGRLGLGDWFEKEGIVGSQDTRVPSSTCIRQAGSPSNDGTVVNVVLVVVSEMFPRNLEQLGGKHFLERPSSFDAILVVGMVGIGRRIDRNNLGWSLHDGGLGGRSPLALSHPKLHGRPKT